MFAPNKTNKVNKAFSYLFRTHLAITISAIVSGRLGAMSRMGRHVKNGSFSSSNMNCMSMDSITEVFYHLNKMLIATKHIADNISR